MLRIGNKSQAILEFLKGKEMSDDIGKNKTLSKHKINISFNAPEDINYMEFKLNLFGKSTSKIVKEGEAFRSTLKEEYKPTIEADTEYCDIYAELKIGMKPGNKIKYR